MLSLNTPVRFSTDANPGHNIPGLYRKRYGKYPGRKRETKPELYSGESLLQIGDNVFHILDPHRETDDIGA